MHKALCLISSTIEKRKFEPGVVDYTYNPNTGEDKARGS
jgi:hypothetical protein